MLWCVYVSCRVTTTDLQVCAGPLCRFAKVEVNCSAPIVPFRETVVVPPKIDMVNEVIDTQTRTVKRDAVKDDDTDSRTDDDDSADEGVSEDGAVTLQTANK